MQIVKWLALALVSFQQLGAPEIAPPKLESIPLVVQKILPPPPQPEPMVMPQIIPQIMPLGQQFICDALLRQIMVLRQAWRDMWAEFFALESNSQRTTAEQQRFEELPGLIGQVFFQIIYFEMLRLEGGCQ